MMNPKRTPRGRLAALSLALCLGLPVATLAGSGHHRDRGERMQQKLEALELDAETRAKVEAVFETSHEDRKARKQQLREAKHQLRELMHDDSVSEQALFDQAEAIADLELESRKARIARHLALRELLTPEQRESLRPRHRRGGQHGSDESRGKRYHRDGADS